MDNTLSDSMFLIPRILFAILGFVLAVAWIILPFVLMSKLNRIVKALERLQWIGEKMDREPKQHDLADKL